MMVMDVVAVFLPSIGVGVIFYFVMRWIFRGDRAERRAQAQMQQDAEAWYRSVREREGTDVPFGYEAERPVKRRGLASRGSIPIRDSNER